MILWFSLNSFAQKNTKSKTAQAGHISTLPLQQVRTKWQNVFGQVFDRRGNGNTAAPRHWSRQKEWWNVENALSIFFQGGIVDNEFTWVKERLFVSQNGNGLHDMAENRPSISLEAR